MNLTLTAFGTWNGGRFMNFGTPLNEAHFAALIHRAYEKGIRTFMTADVYGAGAADEALGKALAGFPRASYCLVGMIGHDFYSGLRDGQKGFPRFTDPRLRSASGYAEYVQMAAEKSLERCKTDRFDCVLLHNPDSIGYSSDAVWKAMHRIQEQGMTEYLGVAPGPANGFTLDLILCFERFKDLLDWAMIILNPLEPWPGSMALPAAVKCGVDLITRVVDYGGIFHDDVKPGHTFGTKDHRTFRAQGWVEQGAAKLEAVRDIAEKHGITMLQLACLWNLSQEPVKSVVPTLIQEVGDSAKPIEAKLDELASLPEITLTSDEVAQIREVGENKGCMALKGGNPEHTGEPLPDRWSLTPDLQAVASRWHIDPAADLTYAHAPATAHAVA
jgi:aryl-alcohol dehydrogenase-like predicted oxidoreductase